MRFCRHTRCLLNSKLQRHNGHSHFSQITDIITIGIALQTLIRMFHFWVNHLISFVLGYKNFLSSRNWIKLKSKRVWEGWSAVYLQDGNVFPLFFAFSSMNWVAQKEKWSLSRDFCVFAFASCWFRRTHNSPSICLVVRIHVGLFMFSRVWKSILNRITKQLMQINFTILCRLTNKLI